MIQFLNSFIKKFRLKKNNSITFLTLNFKVNEKGTEAAAVTGIHIQTKSRPVLEAYAHFDRPFTFLLKDEHTDTILFFGRIIDPTQ